MSEPLIRPFKGTIYNPRRVNDISLCVCPPYDIIPDPKVYYDRSSLNAVRLELPVATPPATEYDEAARTLRSWLDEQILTVDSAETVYVYEQEFQVDGAIYMRRGIIPLVRLDGKRILTHEETRKAAREDRERLIQRLKTFTSLIFSIYEDKGQAVARLIESSAKEKMYDFIDELSITNRFYRMTDRDEIDRLVDLMDDKNIYVADGHHRLSVAFKLGLPYVAMYLTEMHQAGIVILPYHRLIRSEREFRLADLLGKVAGRLAANKVRLTHPDVLKDSLRQLTPGPNPSFCLYSRDDKEHLYILTQERPFFIDEATPESLRRLGVNIGHSGLLKGLFGIQDDEISFVKDATEAVRSVSEQGAALALFVPPTSVDEVRDVAQHGLYMPPKSTYFYPKVITGLVFHTFG